ncbi:MAG TPA: hypothetical protein VFF76_03625 [Holophagaceae bacterium]|jgi:hypothetical protein|nr:hypothetical protein [Holophagaceae bacterium]
MHFALVLPALLALTPATAPQAAKHPVRKDAGTVTIGSDVYRFKPETLSASASKPMALYLKGQLVPVKGGKALAFSFQLFRPGPLGGMMLGPRTGKGASWIATIKTKVDASYAEPLKEGAEAAFTLSGPLMRSEGSQTTETAWQGQIKAAFTSVP